MDNLFDKKRLRLTVFLNVCSCMHIPRIYITTNQIPGFVTLAAPKWNISTKETKEIFYAKIQMKIWATDVLLFRLLRATHVQESMISLRRKAANRRVIYLYIYRKSINGVSIITYLLLHEGQCIINNNNELRVTGYTIVILIYNATYIITDTLILLRAYKDNSHSLPLHYVCTIQHEIVLTIYI